MSRQVTVAATQFACDWNLDGNVARAEKIARAAAKQGAQVILVQELFATPYFCKDHDPKYFSIAAPIAENPAVRRFRDRFAGTRRPLSRHAITLRPSMSHRKMSHAAK